MRSQCRVSLALGLGLVLSGLTAVGAAEPNATQAAQRADGIALATNLSPEDFAAALVGQWASAYLMPDKANILSAEFRTDGTCVIKTRDKDAEKEFAGRYRVGFLPSSTQHENTVATITITGQAGALTLSRVHFGLHNGVIDSRGLLLRVDVEPHGVLARSSPPGRIVPRVSDILPKSWYVKEISLNTVPYGMGIEEGQAGGVEIDIVGPTIVKGPRALNDENESFSLWIMPADYKPAATGEGIQFESARLIGSSDKIVIYAASFTTATPSWTTWKEDVVKQLTQMPREFAQFVLRGRYMMGEPPIPDTIALEEYKKLKRKYSLSEERTTGSGANRRGYKLILDWFDDDAATVAVVEQFKSKGWNWVKAYRVKRNPVADEELGIPAILAERLRAVGGVKYGMPVREVLQLKGKGYTVKSHAAVGSATLIYDDVLIWVIGWDGRENGWVARVDAPRGD